jgi:hypothetical protein
MVAEPSGPFQNSAAAVLEVRWQEKRIAAGVLKRASREKTFLSALRS